MSFTSRRLYKIDSEPNSRLSFLKPPPISQLPLPLPDSPIDPEILNSLQSDDPHFQSEALISLSSIFATQNQILPPDLLLRILSFASSSNPTLSNNACDALYRIISFISPMTEFLLNNGLLSVVASKFPNSNAFYILQNLVVTINCHSAVLDSRKIDYSTVAPISRPRRERIENNVTE
jgi:hypothetical protein